MNIFEKEKIVERIAETLSKNIEREEITDGEREMFFLGFKICGDMIKEIVDISIKAGEAGLNKYSRDENE